MMRRVSIALAVMALAIGAGPLFAQEEPAKARAQAFAELPYWPGYWVSEGQAGTTIGGFAPATLAAQEGKPAPSVPMMSLNGLDASLSEEGRRMQAEAHAKGPRKAMGWGYPMMMNAAAPLQFVITPEETLIINPYGDTRHIYTDGREMPPMEDMWPTVWGTSIGHWEGDTLVIETVQVSNPNDYFHGAPALSEKARYSERIRLEGDRLVDEITIVDPVALTGPWTARLTFIRDQGFDRMIHIHFENDRTVYENGVATIEAPASGE